MEAGFKKILLDKPGAASSAELARVERVAEKHDAKVFMNFQGKTDPIYSKKLKEIKEMKEKQAAQKAEQLKPQGALQDGHELGDVQMPSGNQDSRGAASAADDSQDDQSSLEDMEQSPGEEELESMSSEDLDSEAGQEQRRERFEPL